MTHCNTAVPIMAALIKTIRLCGAAGVSSIVRRKPVAVLTPLVRPMAALAEQPGESFWEKNNRLKRPVSPHLTIYKWEVTMNMSVLHRATGIILASGVYGFGLAMLAAPANFPHYVDAIQAMHLSPGLIYAAKFILAFPLIFHTCTGTRHLFWDLGKGFSIKSVQASAYAAAGLAIVLAAVVAAY